MKILPLRSLMILFAVLALPLGLALFAHADAGASGWQPPAEAAARTPCPSRMAGSLLRTSPACHPLFASRIGR
ncbi:MAG TPA: hypothetical protein VIT92_04540 [Burkholderiaceae bacterium]